ncbi:MAG: hypothetical protein ACJ77A_19025 [Actinomycetota bacterium]
MAGRKERRRADATRPRRATRRHRARVWVERGVLGVMMSVVAAVVERRLLKVIRGGGSSSRAALQKAERQQDRDNRRAPVKQNVTLAAGPDDPDDPGNGDS